MKQLNIVVVLSMLVLTACSANAPAPTEGVFQQGGLTVSRLVAGETGTMNVQIQNANDATGFVQVTPSATNLGFVPSKANVVLADSNTVEFMVTTPLHAVSNEEICVEVCAEGNQVEAGSCDTECIIVQVLAND